VHYEFVFQPLPHPIIMSIQKRGPFPVDEFPHHDLLLELNGHLSGIRSMFDHAAVVIELHQIQTVAQLISPGVDG
jgi:hypothetical protein